MNERIVSKDIKTGFYVGGSDKYEIKNCYFTEVKMCNSNNVCGVENTCDKCGCECPCTCGCDCCKK